MTRTLAAVVGLACATHALPARVAAGEPPAPGATTAPPKYGDLTHLTFSATGPLRAALVSPGDGAASDSIAPTFVVTTGKGGGVELAVGGKVVPFAKIGERSINTRTGETQYRYYGVGLDEGPNVVTITPLGADGARGASTTATIFGPGRPVRLTLAFAGRAVADGRTPVSLAVAGLDRYGHHAAPGTIVKLTIVRGDAHFASTGDLATPVQTVDVALGDGGAGTVGLIPGLQPGEMRVRAALPDVAVEAQDYVAPYLRKALVVGLATTGIGAVPGVPGEPDGAANNVDARKGRIAFYGVGAIARGAQAQVAYDTADSLQRTPADGPFVDDPNERTYQTYGDASTRRDDALSRDHLFARVDANRSSAMWGEFQANTAGASGDGYQQLVAGAKVELAGNNAKLTLFNAHNDVAYARRIFAPTGLATLGTTLHPSIVVGSDIVTLVALDRRTGAVISQTGLARNVDYTLDYGSGLLRFIDPPLPFDLAFNPQQVLVQYEYDGAGANAQTSGGRIEAGLGASQAVRVGAGYVNDATGVGNYTLFGQDVGGKLSGGSWSLAHEASRGNLASVGSTPLAGESLGVPAGAAGNAYRAALTQVAGANRVSFAFDTTSPGFVNPFGGIATAGLLDYRLEYQRLLGSSDAVSIAFDHEQNNIAAGITSTSNAALKLRGHLTKRLALHGGIESISSRGASVFTSGPAAVASAVRTASTTTQLAAGLEYRLMPNVALAIDRLASLSGPQQATQPSQTTAQLSIDTPGHGKIYLRELFADAPVASFAAATTSLTGAAGSTRSTAIGIEQSVGRGTTVDSEYAIENTGNGSDIYSALGAHEKFELGSKLRGDAQIRHAASVGGNGGAFYGYGVSLSYASGTRFRATTNYQLRTGSTPGYTLDLGAAGALSEDVSLALTSNNASTPGFRTVDDRLSVAYRPALDDRAVTIVGFETRDGNVSALGAHAQLLSLEELYRPGGKLELAGRYAYKLDGDAYYPAHSSLFDVRADQRFGARFDVAAETRALAAHGVPGASTTGLAFEAGYRLGGGMRLAGGYNFSGSPDPTLALAPTRRGFYASATTVVDRIFGWGKDDR